MVKTDIEKIFEAATTSSQEDKERSELVHELFHNHQCEQCQRALSYIHFYYYKNGTRDNICKDCITQTLDCEYEPSVRKRCKRYNIPYIKKDWSYVVLTEKEKYGKLYSSKSVFGYYFSKMKLLPYKNFEYSDSEEFNSDTERKEKMEEVKYDIVNKPKHYNREGGFESIEEMEMVFGIDTVMNFCLCNVWKYRYRAADKNGEEDLRKSDWYMRKYQELKDKKRKLC